MRIFHVQKNLQYKLLNVAFLPFLSSIFGSKPQVANYHPVDLGAEQIKALEANLAAWPQIQQLGNLFQQYMLGQYETAIPGFRDILKAGGATTQQMLGKAGEFLGGQIPEDVKNAVYRSSAFQSLGAGTAGSGMSKALTARDLGLTSLNLIDKGAALAGQAGNAAQRWASLSGAQMPEGMLITPQQQSALDMQQELIRQATKQTKFNIAAAPDPVAKGLSDLVANLTGAYLSKGMGGGQTAPKAADWSSTTNWQGNIAQGVGAGGYGGGQAYAAPAAPTGGYYPYANYGYGDSTFNTTPYQSNIATNPWATSQPTNLWDQYAYNSNFG